MSQAQFPGTVAASSSALTNLSATNATTTNLFATNASTSNASSTNFFAALATFTNAISSTFDASIANIVGLTAVNSTTTNATTTNLFADLGSIGTLSAGTLQTTGNGAIGGTLALNGNSGTSTIATGQGFTIGGSHFVVQQGSGDVGIGTTTPSNLLTIQGAGGNSMNGINLIDYGAGQYDSPGISFQNSDGNLPSFLSLSTANNPYFPSSLGLNTYESNGIALRSISSNVNAGINFYTNNLSDRMTITEGGNVGIGTTSPFTNLAVTGSGYFGGTLTASIQDTGGQVVNVKAFGAKGDGVTDDWAAFEAAINAAGPGGHVYVPPSPHNYVISRALQFLDANNNPIPNLTFEVSDGATIECAGDASGIYGNWPFFGCILSGGGGSDGVIAPDNVNSIAAGATTITFSNAGTASNYAVGNIVMVQTSSSFDINPGAPTPTWAQLDRVQAVNTTLNTITVLHPIEQAIPSAQVLKQTNTGGFISAAPGGTTTVPLYASYQLTVRGGNWIADNVYAPFDGGGGCVDCTIAPNTVTASDGVGYGNDFYGTTFSAVSEELGCEIAELSYESSDNTINVGNAHFTNKGCNDVRYLGIYEGSHDNKINITTLDIGDSGGTGDVIGIDRASGNTITIGSIVGSTTPGSLVDIRSSNFTGTSPDTQGNTVSIGYSNLVSQNSCAIFQGANTHNNTVSNTTCYGLVTGGVSFVHYGDGPQNIFENDWSQNGTPTFVGASTTNSLFSNFVGIGTTTPTQALTIQAPAINTLSGIKIADYGTGSYESPSISFEGSDGGLDSSLGLYNSSNPYFPSQLQLASADIGGLSLRSGINGAAPIIFYTNNISERMRITNAGNVGIGTTSPAATLSTAGNEYTTGGLGVGLLNTATGTIQSAGNILGGGTLALSGTTGTTTIAAGQGFMIGGSHFVVQQGSGNVGIGTTTPSQALTIQSSYSGLRIADYGTAAYDYPILMFEGSGSAPVDSQLSLANSNDPYFPSQFQLYSSSVGGLSLRAGNNGAEPIIFYTNNISERMRITNAGNVGIGTTSPAATLSTAGNEYTTGGLGVGLLNTATGTIQSAGNILGGGTLALSGTTGTTTIAAGQGFMIGGSHFVVQQGSGNVGIGTTTPSQALTIQSSYSGLRIADYGTAAYDYPILMFEGSGSAPVDSQLSLANSNDPYFPSQFQLYSSSVGGLSLRAGNNGAEPIIFYTNNISERMRITNAGNVGIGTTSPADLFSVSGDGYFTGGLGVGVDNASAGTLQTTGNGAIGGTLALNGTSGTSTIATGQGFTIGGSHFVVQQGSGNVSIGTSSPMSSTQYALTIQAPNVDTTEGLDIVGTGAGSYDNPGINILGSDAQSGDMVMTNSAASYFPSSLLIYSNDTGGIALRSISNNVNAGINFYTNNLSDRMTIAEGGNVGIGTSTPYARLSVWGSDTASTSALLVANSASTTEFNVLDNGNATLAGTLTQNSDQRLKTNIQSLNASSSLALIDQLNPVTFNWIDSNKGTTPQIGFIAQQVLPIFPNLVSTTSATALTPDGTLSLNYIDLISPIVSAIQALSSEITSIENTVAGFADSFTTNELTFNRATGQELCLQQSDGTPVCVTGDQLAAVLAVANASQSSGQGSGTTSNSDVTTTPDTPPIIQINGDDPAIVQVGETYNDLGVTITGPTADLNLGVTTYVNGIETSPVQIDTSAAATDTINYVVTDENGLSATSTRTVIIEAPSIVPTSEASTTGATSTTPA